MVDDLQPAQPIEAEQPEAPKQPGFFASSTGKLVIAGVAALVLLAIAGVAAYMFLLSGVTEPEPVLPPVASQPSAETSAAPVDPADPALSETFSFRNIFKPTVAPPLADPDDETDGTGTGTDTGGSTDGGDTSTAPDELKLVSIQTTDSGVRTATLAWNGETFVLEEGETIPDSPWKVVDIGTDSVSVIYGDSSPIELSVGDSVSK